LSKKHSWLAPVIIIGGLLITGIAAFVQYVVANNKPIHRNPDDVPSVMQESPAEKWSAAVEKSRQVARAEILEENLPGLSVAVGIDGEIVWAEGFGWADLDTHALVSPDTRFRIGHVSNSLTSAGVGLLLEERKLRLDDEIQEYVPDFPKKPWPITLRQLMGNVSGIHHYRDTEWGDKPTVHCERASEGLRSFANDPLLFEPETQYRYSTYGWVLVSAAVEAAAGEPFFQFMRARVFEPLRMSHTSVDLESKAIPDRATSYYRGNLGKGITTNVDYSCFAGGGAFLSTPSDLVRFGAALASGAFLERDTVRTLQARQQLRSGQDTNYGLGWMLDNVELAGRRTRLVSHASRTIEGGSATLLTFPDLGLIVAVSTNMSFAAATRTAMAVAEAFAAR
jgi:CubicO group peptidase (beta-lactamase class C family)